MLVTEYIRPKPFDRILDIGCGTISTLPFLPECKYVSVDAILGYVCTALDGTGVAESSFANAWAITTCLSLARIVLALGLRHHLDDDEARSRFRLGHAAPRPSGRVLTNDRCCTQGQQRIEGYFLSCDRGKFVRTQAGYVALAHSSLAVVIPHLRNRRFANPLYTPDHGMHTVRVRAVSHAERVTNFPNLRWRTYSRLKKS